MELSERWIKKFEDEGYSSIYEQQDAPGTIHEERIRNGKVSLFVTDGSITLDLSGEKKDLKAGQRLDIPAGIPHSVVVGPQGWIGIIGEE
jgi:quercetin dioxygenase-like cupin family protein